MPRAILTNRRPAITFEFEHSFDPASKRPLTFLASVGCYASGDIGEVFLNSTKLSSESDAYARDAAIAISFALQHGATVSEMKRAMTRNSDGNPSSPIGKLLDLLEEL